MVVWWSGDASIILEWFVCTKTLTPLCIWEISVLLVYDYFYKLPSWNSPASRASLSCPVHRAAYSKECLGQQGRSAWWIAPPHSDRQEGRGGGECFSDHDRSRHWRVTTNFKLSYNITPRLLVLSYHCNKVWSKQPASLLVVWKLYYPWIDSVNHSDLWSSDISDLRHLRVIF